MRCHWDAAKAPPNKNDVQIGNHPLRLGRRRAFEMPTIAFESYRQTFQMPMRRTRKSEAALSNREKSLGYTLNGRIIGYFSESQGSQGQTVWLSDGGRKGWSQGGGYWLK